MCANAALGSKCHRVACLMLTQPYATDAYCYQEPGETKRPPRQPRPYALNARRTGDYFQRNVTNPVQQWCRYPHRHVRRYEAVHMPQPLLQAVSSKQQQNPVIPSPQMRSTRQHVSMSMSKRDGSKQRGGVAPTRNEEMAENKESLRWDNTEQGAYREPQRAVR